MSRVGLIYLKRFLNVFCCNWGKRQSVDNGHPSWRFTSRTMSYGKAGQIVGTNLLTGYYEWGRTCEGAPLNTWPLRVWIWDDMTPSPISRPRWPLRRSTTENVPLVLLAISYPVHIRSIFRERILLKHVPAYLVRKESFKWCVVKPTFAMNLINGHEVY